MTQQDAIAPRRAAGLHVARRERDVLLEGIRWREVDWVFGQVLIKGVEFFVEQLKLETRNKTELIPEWRHLAVERGNNS